MDGQLWKGSKLTDLIIKVYPVVSVDTVRVLDLAGDSGLDDGGRGVPQQEALAYTRCGELLQLGCD